MEYHLYQQDRYIGTVTQEVYEDNVSPEFSQWAHEQLERMLKCNLM